MTDTPGTLEERLRRNSGWRNERHQCVTDPNLLTEAADEIASLRARVEAAYAANSGLRDALSRATETMAAQRGKLEELRQALKDTPDQ